MVSSACAGAKECKKRRRRGGARLFVKDLEINDTVTNVEQELKLKR